VRKGEDYAFEDFETIRAGSVDGWLHDAKKRKAQDQEKTLNTL
jgi:hypothetical protein